MWNINVIQNTPLFDLYMDTMMMKATEEVTGGVMFGSERVVDLDFAGDVALLSDLWLVMVALIMRMEQNTQRFELIYVHGRVKYCLSSEVKEMLEWKTCS